MLKSAIRKLLHNFPLMQKWIYDLRFAIQQPKILSAKRDYKYTDEHLKFVHILECINYIRVAGAERRIPPIYFEFGCHSGRTFSAAVRASRYLKLDGAEFFAFDSFEGLPQTNSDLDGIFKTGTFLTSRTDFIQIVKKKTGLKLDNDHIIQGFYCDSLTFELQKRLPNAGMIHIDVDLYSSAVDVLNFIKPLMVVGTILIFDDWYCFPPGSNMGEKRALTEFCEKNPTFKIKEWKAYSTFGQSFFVTALP